MKLISHLKNKSSEDKNAPKNIKIADFLFDLQ